MQNTTSQTMEGLWIDLDILNDTNLSLQEKFTLAIIRALDKNNGCFASNKYFAEILHVTPKRASDIIQSLITKNYITSTIEDNYKRTIRVVKNTLPQEENIEEEAPQEQQEL
ncbi:MAG: helix-turn-helix domain-containing protein, partial [Clostridiales bacterium]|nr:helix-turn-helix domain-containing protein [Clostridiales bacterium]